MPTATRSICDDFIKESDKHKPARTAGLGFTRDL
eukprot:CAMPEP_0169257298 /NCGR_PEP_ID=MMETSP1016-20121227/40762_1 /TAXON_ID=342587 /ORGANISM="Karlodinium micrum, Strain CCMP2283" /LENGTH=33 /DNA_ID= /DNA_START= /DNA_END= /DNA_ORIENTATION=